MMSHTAPGVPGDVSPSLGGFLWGTVFMMDVFDSGTRFPCPLLAWADFRHEKSLDTGSIISYNIMLYYIPGTARLQTDP